MKNPHLLFLNVLFGHRKEEGGLEPFADPTNAGAFRLACLVFQDGTIGPVFLSLLECWMLQASLTSHPMMWQESTMIPEIEVVLIRLFRNANKQKILSVSTWTCGSLKSQWTLWFPKVSVTWNKQENPEKSPSSNPGSWPGYYLAWSLANLKLWSASRTTSWTNLHDHQVTTTNHHPKTNHYKSKTYIIINILKPI